MNAEPTTGFSPTLSADLLKFMPAPIAAAVQDYAANTGLSEAQVLELAIAGFLDMEAPTFANIDLSQLRSFAEMKARLEFLEEAWLAVKEGKMTQQVIDQTIAMGW